MVHTAQQGARLGLRDGLECGEAEGEVYIASETPEVAKKDTLVAMPGLE